MFRLLSAFIVVALAKLSSRPSPSGAFGSLDYSFQPVLSKSQADDGRMALTSDKRMSTLLLWLKACGTLIGPPILTHTKQRRGNFYELAFERKAAGWQMIFRKSPEAWTECFRRFGKNVIVTDRKDWSTEDIVQAALDRYIVEKAFRQTKDDDLVGALPIRHFTYSKIRCHFLTCVVALTYLGLLENRLKKAGLNLSAAAAVSHMRQLHSCLGWINKQKKPTRIIEQPTPEQANILKAFHYKITHSGALQPLES